MVPVRYILVILTLIVFFANSASNNVYAQGVITELSKREIPVDWDFTGTNILLFGSIEKQALNPEKLDVVIVVKGPDRSIYARKKKRIAGVWVNAEAKNYKKVPAFYSIVSSRPLSKIAKESDLELVGIGFKSLTLTLAQGNGKIENGEPDEYSRAIVRLMRRDGMYIENPTGVKIIGGGQLFRANIRLPSNVPVGKYHSFVYLFHANELVGVSTRPLYINKQGLERRLYLLAYEFPYVYGILAVVIAVLSGVVATAVFKDD